MRGVTTRINRSPSPNAEYRPALAALAERWPTPTAADGDRASATYARGNPTLKGTSQNWATPLAMDSRMTGNQRDRSGPTLTDQAVRSGSWATPRASPAENRTTNRAPSHLNSTHGPHLSAQALDHSGPRVQESAINGKSSSLSTHVLAPSFVETLMGLPFGWTAFEPLGTEWCRWWRQWRSVLCSIDFAGEGEAA